MTEPSPAILPVFLDATGYEEGLALGELTRHGQKIHDGEHFIKHLPEVFPDNEVLKQIQDLLHGKKKVDKNVAIGLGVTLGVLVVAAGAYWGRRVFIRRKLAKLIAAYNAALSKYLEAIVSSTLTTEQLDALILSLQQLSTLKRIGKTEQMLVGQVVELANVIVQYTSKLAELNNKNLDHLPELEPGTTERLIDDLVIYLEAQRDIVA